MLLLRLLASLFSPTTWRMERLRGEARVIADVADGVAEAAPNATALRCFIAAVESHEANSTETSWCHCLLHYGAGESRTVRQPVASPVPLSPLPPQLPQLAASSQPWRTYARLHLFRGVSGHRDRHRCPI